MIVVRRYRDSDATALVNIFYNTIHKINSKDYSDEQIKAWAPDSFLSLDGWQAKWINIKPFVAEINDQIVGLAEFEDSGFIDCFYVHHDFQGQGVGTALMENIQDEALTKKINNIFADVSITAKPFFQSQGFVVVREQTVEKRGQHLKNYHMNKAI